jgi:hypothetical protein
MRTGFRMARLRRLVRLLCGAITGAAAAIRRWTTVPLASVREKLGRAGDLGMNLVAARGVAPLEGGADGSPHTADRFHAGSTGPRQAAAARAAEAADERSVDAPQPPEPLDRAAEATAQLQHVALVVPPEPGAAVGKGTAGPPPAESTDIPWGYGKDRVTAAALDPNRLYVYWEVTDEAIARARAALGAAGGDAWLNLRVYDTTGILFDGTNAHHHFDHGLGRSERQWFFEIRRPTSTAFVELGLRARDGGFARIARSNRVDFPRTEPAPWSDPEWMTVVAATGDARLTGRGMPSQGGAFAEPSGLERQDGAPLGAPRSFMPIPLWVIRDASGHATWVRELGESGWERVEWREVEREHWFEFLGRVEWEGPHTFTTWEAGPFTYPVEVHEPTREEWEGQSVAYRVGGVTRVVHGPWQVVIRDLGAHVSRTVLGRWQIYRSWVAEGGREVRSSVAARPRALGASEAFAGGSERAWASGSELRLGGASEVWRLGASELRFGGASERLYAGGSQQLVRGASEQGRRGASEWLVRGASERVHLGASERLQQGASERLYAGASEKFGASEQRLGASEGRLAPPKTAGAGYPKPE